MQDQMHDSSKHQFKILAWIRKNYINLKFQKNLFMSLIEPEDKALYEYKNKAQAMISKQKAENITLKRKLKEISNEK